jgi:capsular polysaccharide biosynthesis protein
MTSQKYKKWQEEILGLIGVKNRAIFLAEPTRFRKMHLPETGFTPECSFTPEFDAFVSRVSPSVVVPGRRCWLSRSLLPPGSGGVLGEERIEAEAQRLGWSIYHPQQHSVTDQLSFLSSCEDIAGWSGSAFHAVVLLTELRSRLHIFARGTHMGTMFRAIADQKKFQQTDYLADLELISGSRANAIWRLKSESAIIDVLRAITFESR